MSDTPTPTHSDRLADLAERLGATVAKDAHNSHGNYDYASADAIYRHCRGAILGAGLMVFQDEIDGPEFIERANSAGRKSTWARVTYMIGCTSKLGISEGGERVTVLVQITGSQSLGAARTYALKYWLRGKLLLATGDQSEDLDSTPAEFDRPARPAKPRKPADPETGFKTWASKKRAELAPMTADDLAVEYLKVGLEKGKTEKELTDYLERVLGSSEPSEWNEKQLERIRGWLLN